MDTSMRKLLLSAEKYSGNAKNPHLHQLYTLLRNASEGQPTVDAPESFGQDLYVLCAEFAYEHGHPDIARDCIRMFFMKHPPTNQFLCRAYLCQARLVAPQNTNDLEQLEKAIAYILKAVTFAKDIPRYHFLVYNASVIYWQFCRPFLKPSYRQHLTQSLIEIVKALDDINDDDYEWRAQLMLALIECLLDARRLSDASEMVKTASSFIKGKVPSLYKTLFRLMVRHKFIDDVTLQKEIEVSPELAVYSKICKLKNEIDPPNLLEAEPAVAIADTNSEVANEDEIKFQESSRPVSFHESSQEKINKTEDEDDTRYLDEKKKIPQTKDIPQEIKILLLQLGVPLKQSSVPFALPAEPFQRMSTRRRSSLKGILIPEQAISKKERAVLVLEIARLCIELNLHELALTCVEAMKNYDNQEPGFYLELEFVECELAISSLGDKQDTYQKTVVDTRLETIKRCEEALMNALRLDTPQVIQAGCVTLWNLCLPLLQSNMRHWVLKPLAMIAESLESIDSLLMQLRCQVYMELAHCQEDKEHIQAAIDNLKKALLFDDGNVYRERLEILLHRLELRALLYKQPERAEDQAAMIIEQSRSGDSGNSKMNRFSMVKAGEVLSPDAFLKALESENEIKDHSGGKDSVTKSLAGMANNFNKCVKQTEGHLRRLGAENDKERARLWADLAKVARKHEVWDICRVACRFCLLYDDGRWGGDRNPKIVPEVVGKPVKSKTSKEKVDEENAEISTTATGSQQTVASEVTPFDRDLIRMMAEVAFINGEALVQFLRSKNVQLNQKPSPPEIRRTRDMKNLEEDEDWITYCSWIKDLSDQATNSFLRGLELGVVLEEAWIVYSAAAYVWNYNTHILSQDRHTEIVPQLTALLEAIQKVGFTGETSMLVNICDALAQGLIRPWVTELNKVPAKQEYVSPVKGKPAKTAAPAKSKLSGLSINTGAMADLRRAIDICEFAMQATNGNNPKDAAPIYVRMAVLQTWVQAKQLAQQQISRQFGTSDVRINNQNQNEMTRCIVALEMISLSKNGIMEFKDAPELEELISMTEKTGWTDRFVELQIWTRLTFLAFQSHNHNLVMHCSKKALRFASLGTQPRDRKMDLNQNKVEQELLSCASLLQGQSIVENMQYKESLRREALEVFLSSVKYARTAGSYGLVMAATRHFWNTSLPMLNQPITRELLKDPLKVILECIAAVTGKKPLGEAQDDEEGNDQALSETVKDNKSAVDNTVKASVIDVSLPKVGNGVTVNSDKDLTLRAAMYGALLQCYADKGEWQEALNVIDKALYDMPRTKHRLLIFKHRAIVKVRLGYPVDVDMQKFQDESEDVLSQMWYKMALNSTEMTDQLLSYQHAIETLEDETSSYQKAEYLLEFAQWLYSNQFPIEDVEDQIGWAIDILLNIKPPIQADDKHHKEKQKGTKELSVHGIMKKSSNSNVNKSANNSQEKMAKKTSQKSIPHFSTASSTSSTLSSVHKESLISTVYEDNSMMKANESSVRNFIPVAKVPEIGVLPANPQLSMDDVSQVRQLDALIRSHVLLTEITGTESKRNLDTLLLAFEFLMRLWKVLINVYASSIKEIVKTGGVFSAKDDQSKKPKSGKKDDKEEKKEEKKREEKPKIKRKCPVDAIPSDLETWATYDWPDEGLEAFTIEELKYAAITQDNIPKPMLTFYYVDRLVTKLRDLGYHHLTLPVLAFQDLLSRSVVKSNALNKLVHLRMLEVCQELNIKSAVTYHQRVIGPMFVNVEEQAVSRVEIAQWQEKQKLKAEKQQQMRSKQSNSPDNSARPANDSPETLKVTEDPSPFNKILSGVSLREVWTDTAEVLIRQGLYQRAREFLNEANIAAQAFNDEALQARILLLFAKLAYYEAQYGLTIRLCQKAEELKPGDEKFWFEVCDLQAKALVKENPESHRQAKKLLTNAIQEFVKVGDRYSNRLSVTKLYCSKLEAKFLQLHLKSVLQRFKDLSIPRVHQAVLEICERYEYLIGEQMNLKLYGEVVHNSLRHGRILRMLAKNAKEKELQRIHYFQTLNVFRQTAFIAESMYTDAHTLFPLAELKGMSTPVQRELAYLNIELGEIMTEILESREKELRHQQLQEERKSSIVQLVQEYVMEPTVVEENEEQWTRLGRFAGDEAMSFFLCAYNLSTGIPYLKAKCLAGLGKLLRVTAEIHDPNPPLQWMVFDVNELKKKLAEEEAELKAVTEMQDEEDASETSDMENPEHVEDKEHVEDQHEEEPPPEEDNTSPEKRAMFSQQMAKNKKQYEISKFYYMCASECLAQCLNVSLQQSFTDLLAEASLDVFVIIGQHDPSAASAMLSLHQSCQASLAMQNVLFKSQPDPVTSQLAALLHQRQHLLKKDIKTNLGTSPLFKDITSTLSRDWQAWKKLEITHNNLDLVKEFPSNYILIVLQHSPDKQFLYAALLDKAKSSIQANVKPKGSEKNVGRSRVYKEPVEFSQLTQILSKLQEYKQKQRSQCLKMEYKHMQATHKEKNKKNPKEDHVVYLGETESVVTVAQSEDSDKEAELEKEFSEIVEALHAYLEPVLEPICSTLREENNFMSTIKEASSGGVKEKEKASKDTSPKNECIVLLADFDLLQLPLETIIHQQILDSVNSVTRDFSLQLLYNRNKADKQDTVDPKVDGKKKSSTKDGNKLSRIPGLREAKQRQVKIIPIDRHLMPWQAPVNTHLFRYIVDPFLDSVETDNHEPVKEFEKILTQYEQQFTSKWLGLLGNDHTASVGEWEIYLTESSSFIFYGTERFLAYIPPHKMSALNISDCQILLTFDQVQTVKSFQRQCKLDCKKSQEALSLESPLETAVLASLAGVRSILLNQWHSSLPDNTDKINRTMTYLLQRGKTTGQTSFLLQNSLRAFIEEKTALAADEKSKQETRKGKGLSKDDKKRESIKNQAKQSIKPQESYTEMEIKPKGLPVANRNVFNMVCYGMPNLVVIQESTGSGGAPGPDKAKK